MLTDAQFRELAIRLLSEDTVSEVNWLSLKEGLEGSDYNKDIIQKVKAVSHLNSNDEEYFRYCLPESWNR